MIESGKENFLIDGFPRNKDNLDGWNRQMGTKANLKGVLFFECSEQVLYFFYYVPFGKLNCLFYLIITIDMY
jgi:hypothetical protein